MLFVQIKPPGLKLRHALVLSLVLRRFNVGKGTSRRYIERQTGIDRTRTLPNILNHLVASGLIEVDPRTKLLRPREPTGEAVGWLVWKKNPALPWHKRLSHFKLLLRAGGSPLSLEQNVVYWKLRDLERQGRTRQTVVGLATRLLGVSRPTVTNALARLKALSLVDYQQDGNRVAFRTALPDEARAWFATNSGKGKGSEVKVPLPDLSVPAVPDAAPGTDSPLVAELVRAGLDRKRAVVVLGWYEDVDLVPSSDLFDSLKASAAMEHRENGRSQPELWGPLFYWKVRQLVEKRRPQVEAEALRRERESADFAALLKAADGRGYRTVDPGEKCCGTFAPHLWRAGDRRLASPEKAELRRLFSPFDVEEKTGDLLCVNCDLPIPDMHRWFEVSHHGKTHYLLPPDRPEDGAPD